MALLERGINAIAKTKAPDGKNTAINLSSHHKSGSSETRGKTFMTQIMEVRFTLVI